MAETKKKNNGSLPVGTILRNGQYQYRIGEVLGQGNYGITYKASAMVKIGNISKPMTFAIKENFAKQYCSRKADGVTMSYSSVHAEEAKRDLKDFVAEGKTLAQICNGHKNIVNVNETFEENNTAYYVMEFIEGGNLCDLVKSKVRLTENEAIQIFVPIVDAVSHIHKNRRLHLDIKPENIMLKKDGTPILIDFGITLHFNANGGLTGTSKDRSGGLSEGYAPMEQYSGVTTFAPEIDVYALGATLYYMLVGKDPAKASDISTKKIEAALPLDISEITRSALLHAMRKLAEDRTPSADEFLIELRKLGVKPERVKPKNNSVLPIGYVVGLGSEKYSIVELISRSENVITYKAIGTDVQHRNNIYILYELFLEGDYSRNSDMSVNNPDGELVGKYFFSHDGEYGNVPTSLTNARYEEIKSYMPEIIAPGSDIDSDGKNSKFWFNNTLYVAKWLEEEIIVPKRSNYNYKKIAGVSLSCILGLFVASLVSKPVANMFSTNSEMSSSEVANSMSVDGFPIYDDATGRVIFKYTGTLVNGQPEGKGTAIYSDGEWESYSGYWKNGKRSGQHCVLKYKNGDEFSGSFSDDHMMLGSFHSKSNQSTFIGSFMDNKPYNGSWTTATGEQIVVNEGHKN